MDVSDLSEWRDWQKRWPRPSPSNTLFDACFRIQREACEAAGRHIPLIVENVRGAVKGVSHPVKWHFGSYYLWGDVPALMPITLGARKVASGIPLSKVGFNVQAVRQMAHGDASLTMEQGRKVPGFRFDGSGKSFQSESVKMQQVGVMEVGQPKRDKDSFGWQQGSELRQLSSRSPKRKAASAQIAKIPFPLAQHIARTFKIHRVSTDSLDSGEL